MKRAFEFCAGSLSLNLVDTLAGRTNEPTELLVAPEDLRLWLQAAGFGHDFELGQTQLESVKDLREAAFGLLSTAVDKKSPLEDQVTLLNEWSAHKDFRPRFEEGELVMVSDHPFESIMAMIAANALLLLESNRVSRLRRCCECEMLFVDLSRPGKRRWCSSSSGCGNRAKVRRHRARKRAEMSGD
ncbi:ABATE domain-containing protein [Pelagibius sp. Alg239-R121]|uniref:CGNR zinc finger domain-containing protein n=1 Tax=Pelagibius sp. Alg239-R121 TaxID=2993448 RepID=UPI0024A78C8E|nr:ABATE domain-containing protein [Pelagibius sp. Alg239-R121]